MITSGTLRSADGGTSDPHLLRLVREDDLDALEVLDKEVFRDLAYSKRYLRIFYNLFHTTWYVVERDGELAGYALIGPTSDRSEAWLLGLAVGGRHQGHGLGHRLMTQTVNVMQDLGVADGRMTMRPDNAAALRLYNRFGFEQDGDEREDYYGNDEPRKVLRRRFGAVSEPARRAGGSDRLGPRRVEEDDLDALESLNKQVFHDRAYSRHYLRTFFNLFHTTWYVIEHDGEPAGYALIGPTSDRSEAWLLGLAVGKQHRRRGLACRLMAHTVDVILELGITDGRITAPLADDALSLFKEFGFEQDGDEREDYYGSGEHRRVLHRSFDVAAEPARR